MGRLILTLISSLSLVTGCSKQGLLTPAQFTTEFAEAFGKVGPEFHVKIVRDLELKIIGKGGRDFTLFLDNAFDTYRQEPEEKQKVIAQYVASGIETYTASLETVDETRIVPVIKDTGWLEETRQATRTSGEQQPPEYVYDDLNGDLVILYAEDSARSIRYLTPSSLRELKVDRKALRETACKNLKNILPPIERYGNAGLYRVTAGGDYEASLLLLDTIWNRENFDVKGDFVVAVPTRDVLLVTGSNDGEGIARLKALAKKSYDDGSYRLTPKLFICRNGKFIPFLK